MEEEGNLEGKKNAKRMEKGQVPKNSNTRDEKDEISEKEMGGKAIATNEKGTREGERQERRRNRWKTGNPDANNDSGNSTSTRTHRKPTQGMYMTNPRGNSERR